MPQVLVGEAKYNILKTIYEGRKAADGTDVMAHFTTTTREDRKSVIDALPKRELSTQALIEWNKVRPTIGIIPTALFRTENGIEPKNNIIVCGT